MWIVTIVLLGLAASGLSGEVQQRSQRKRSRRETLLDAETQATKVAYAGEKDVGQQHCTAATTTHRQP